MWRICLNKQGSSVNVSKSAGMPKFWIWQGSEYASVTEFWIWQGSEYASVTEFWIEQGSEYARVTKGSKSVWTGHLIFQKGQGRLSPSPWCASVGVAEYAPISLNILKYPWKCLNKLFWLCQSSENALSFYMFDRLLNIPRFLNVPGFGICHDCICKGCTRCLNMAQYALMPLIMPEYSWIFQNDPEYAWINCSMSGFPIWFIILDI